MVSGTATFLWYWTEEPTRSRSPRASMTISCRRSEQTIPSSCSGYLTEVHTDSACVRTGKNFAKLQFNQKYKKVGFRSDYPSITAILDEYNLPLNRMVRLTCIPRKSQKGEPYYEIMRPNSNLITWQQDKK